MLALGAAAAQEGEAPNLALPTLGGLQMWTDLRVAHEWRLQQHAWTGHTRLLDPAGVRRCWGGAAACEAAMETMAPAPGTAPVVVLVHGLGRSRESLETMAEALRAAGWRAERFEYASTRAALEDHAAALTGVLNGLAADMPAGERRSVSFVTHSLGALVVRAALDPAYDWQQNLAPQRAVFLAPPNQGSALAETIWDLAPARWLLGGGGAAAVPPAPQMLPIPDFPFAVIAGVRDTSGGFNPLVPGDDDGVVGVAETWLAGAAAWQEVAALHTFIADDDAAIAATLAFLAGGQVGSPP